MCSSGCPEAHSVGQAGLRLTEIHLPLPPKAMIKTVVKGVSPYPAFTEQFFFIVLIYFLLYIDLCLAHMYVGVPHVCRAMGDQKKAAMLVPGL